MAVENKSGTDLFPAQKKKKKTVFFVNKNRELTFQSILGSYFKIDAGNGLSSQAVAHQVLSLQ